MTSVEQVAIIAACRADAATRGRNTGCILVGSKYVKYGDSMAMVSQIETRSHLSMHLSTAKGGPDKPRTPELISHFDDGQGTTYLVMELVKLVESPPELDTRIVDAIKWLATVPAPPGHLLGPLGCGCIRHSFFADGEAPEPYVSVQALKRYMDKKRVDSLKLKRRLDDDEAMSSKPGVPITDESPQTIISAQNASEPHPDSLLFAPLLLPDLSSGHNPSGPSTSTSVESSSEDLDRPRKRAKYITHTAKTQPIMHNSGSTTNQAVPPIAHEAP
ncbi:hypothetical protein NLJ89_g1900 [Agrocybe chaxingu]|uniref:Uncharacterized protein n=1 Tax=Agrocybe chaxingu TaxID=84603 RepID=A0A9W8MZ68_9AGAR|nr:hypothetical protein NLJ89_g1900 [Agrocybe chaxingu]